MTRRPLFTAEELAEIARADAEIEAQEMTMEEIRESREREAAIIQSGRSEAETKYDKRRREYREENREKSREYNKAYYAAHREKYRAYHKAYYQANRDKAIAYQRAYREEKKREREQAAALQGG